MELKVDILAFGVHPDDVELGCAGTLIKHVKNGKKVGIVDLTKGQLGTRGTPELRLKEAALAAEIIGAEFRDNLEMEDGFFENNWENKLKIIQKIRQYRPDVIICNAPNDRHPDHGRAAALVKEAAFYSGLRKITTVWNGNTQESWRPEFVYHYIQDYYIKPSMVVDITPYFEQKMKAIKAFSSQFYNPQSTEPVTPIATKEFLEVVRGRALEFGRLANTVYAEGFVSDKPVVLNFLV
ncbi:MAG: bacillithiol biosynthesis deacetylase BshB1 [Bacteroidetes bacterium]|nr:MAG: bacillithiol biosynthesis deacetylase BshB1 [Bacteroidota bacterium]